jgi:hypothetical protein
MRILETVEEIDNNIYYIHPFYAIQMHRSKSDNRELLMGALEDYADITVLHGHNHQLFY